MSLNEPILQKEALEVPYPPRRCFNIYSAAQYCACKCAAIEQAIHDGELKAIRLGRGYVITRESLDRFIDAREAVRATYSTVDSGSACCSGGERCACSSSQEARGAMTV